MGSVRIPDRPFAVGAESSLGGSGSAREGSAAASPFVATRSSIIDLTNVTEAAQGDPVLLSYFSAIREQIQQVANQQTWSAVDANEGLIYVCFELNARGIIREISVEEQRSAPSESLRMAAMRIVQAAAPFPPFPPSFDASSKTIMVPLEFVLR